MERSVPALPASAGVRLYPLAAGNRFGRRPALIADLGPALHLPAEEILERARDLAREAGDPFIDAATHRAAAAGGLRLVIRHDRPRAAATLLRIAMSGEPVHPSLEKLRRGAPTPVEHAIITRARERGIPAAFGASPGDRVRLGEGARLRRLARSVDDRTGVLGTLAAMEAPAVLRAAGLPVEAEAPVDRRLLVVGGRCVAGLPAARGGEALAVRVAALLPLPIVRIDLAASGAIAGVGVDDALDAFIDSPEWRAVAADAAIDHLVGPSGAARIPVVAFAGAEAETAAARQAGAWAAQGLRVGQALPTGLVVGRLALHRDDRRGRRGLPLLLDNPTVDAAVAVLDPGDVLASGLGHDRIDRAETDLPPRDPACRLLATLAGGGA